MHVREDSKRKTRAGASLFLAKEAGQSFFFLSLSLVRLQKWKQTVSRTESVCTWPIFSAFPMGLAFSIFNIFTLVACEDIYRRTLQLSPNTGVHKFSKNVVKVR